MQALDSPLAGSRRGLQGGLATGSVGYGAPGGQRCWPQVLGWGQVWHVFKIFPRFERQVSV